MSDYSKLNVIAPPSTSPSAKRGHGAKSADRPWQRASCSQWEVSMTSKMLQELKEQQNDMW